MSRVESPSPTSMEVTSRTPARIAVWEAGMREQIEASRIAMSPVMTKPGAGAHTTSPEPVRLRPA